MAHFDTELATWLEAVKTQVLAPQINNEWEAKHQQTYMTLIPEDGKKFVRIVSSTLGTSRSAWAFVAMTDGQSKGLGSWKQGDIFKAASWASPAKHARGNIFNTINGPTCGIVSYTGPEYR